MEKYPDYEAEFDGIGAHWGGKTDLGKCSQAAIFRLKTKREKIMPLDVDFNAQFGQKEGEYRQKLAVTIRKFDLKEQLTEVLGVVLGPYGINSRNRRDSEESEDVIPIHIDSGVRRIGYYDQPKVQRESWLPEMKAVPSSYIPNLAYPPTRLNIAYYMKVPLRNDDKADFSNAWSGNYVDIEDEKPVEIIPVVKVESADFKNFSTCWGRKSPDNTQGGGWGDSDGGGWGESGDENVDSGWDSKPPKVHRFSESSEQKEDIWSEDTFTKVLFLF